MIVIAFHVLRIFLATAFGWFLCRRVGLLPSLVTGLLCATLASIFGYWLLMQTAVNEVSWKNFVGGWLIPWGYMIAPKSLATIAMISTLIWTALIGLGALASLKSGQPVSEGPVSPTSLTTSVLLLTSWVIFGAAITYLLNQLSMTWDASKQPGSTIAIAMAVLAGVLLASICCRFFGLPRTALLIAGGPILLCGILYGIFIAIVLVGGNSSRWN